MIRVPLVLAALTLGVGGSAAWAEPVNALATNAQGLPTLITFDTGAPLTLIGSPMAITGFTAGDALVGIDRRPLDGALVGVGYNSAAGTGRVYQINPATGTATQINTNAINFGTGVTSFGVDFNPVPNALRIVSNALSGATSDNNFRITAGGTGTVNIDTDLNPGAPNVRGAAYSNNRPGGAGGVTTLYLIDAATGNLVTQGGLNGNPSPNLGTLNTVGALTGLAAANVTSFDISPTGLALLSSSDALFSLNLSNGAVTSLGNTPAGFNILAIAVPEPGSLALCGLAAAGVAGYVRRRRRAAAEASA